MVVGRRAHVVARRQERRVVARDVAGRQADREDRLLPLPGAVEAFVDAGRVPERPLDRGREALEDVGPVVVVHREDAAGREVLADLVERFLGEQVTLEAQRRLPSEEGQGVGQGEQDQVVALVGALRGTPVRRRCGRPPVDRRRGARGDAPRRWRGSADRSRRPRPTSAPWSSATATSLPLPAPTIRTSPGSRSRWA